FPAFESEMSASDTVALAETRTANGIPYNKWDRAPHPVVDVAHLKASGDAPAFRVYGPGWAEMHLGGTLSTLTAAEVRARNHRGEVRRFFKDQTPPDRDDLRRFFGFDP